MPTQFEVGFLVGLLVGEGHFGGDGRQPQVTLRMHVRHEAIFRWLERTFPGGRLYGPYHHGGRDYFQWMARGPFLQDELAPLLDQWLSPDLDRHSFDRYQLMKANYPQLARDPAGYGESAAPPAGSAGRPHAAASSTASTRARDEHGTGSRSASSVTPAPDPGPLADLFSQLREAWPS
jgi:hypothetical protein